MLLGSLLTHEADRDQSFDQSPQGLSARLAPSSPNLFRHLSLCGGVDSLRTWFRQCAQSMGFYGGRYLHLGHQPSGEGEESARSRPIRFLSTAGNEGADGASSRWQFDDPSIGVARTAFSPFVWSTRCGDDFTDRQRAWVRAERSRGVGAGIAIPIQDYQAGPAYLSLFGMDEAQAVRLLDERAPDFAFIGAQFHAHAKATLPIIEGTGTSGSLTHREIECLRLAAIGWTVSASATALGIASRTVEFHLGNAAGKLSAVNKIHAVAIATSKRLIAV